MGKPKLSPLVQLIADEMARQGLTANALAVRAGVAAATVTRVLKGERADPQVSTLQVMASALGGKFALVVERELARKGKK
jgi:transcriptional regulator with XRE-family HTH domain